ncbi:transposase [Nonlabens dokdonensis]|uniref:Transposase n=1 Tax=Nonlabens dokdonensis TaxID=328515 RepID=A0A1Z8AHT6_9FLAO|nr:transposase [Nonlabens dokdonensis]OUS09905.1 transposase [Nonlabens dokdonensis]
MYDKIESDKYYHIFNQANGMIDIFQESRNYPFFIDKMEKHLTPVCEIIAFCLMKNHFHLVIKTKQEIEELKISRAFANLFIGYAKAYNKVYNRSGSLFKKPFKRKLIESEVYLKNLILYVHCNPVKDGFVEDLISYPWSSYHEIIDDAKTFVDREFVLELFDDSTNFVAAHKAYQLNTSFLPTFE